jgi:hypothetical protein
MGMLPAVLLWRIGAIDRTAALFFYTAFAAIILCLLIYYILHRWHHAAAITLLTLGFPLLFYIFVAVLHPVFLPLFYGTAGLIVIAGVLGAAVSGNWSWAEIGKNLAFFCTVLLVALCIGSRFDLIYVEAGLLASGAFGITRLCDIDMVSWLSHAPRWIARGMHKVWY